MSHTPDCEKAQTQRAMLQDAFRLAHPLMCRTCDGIGASFWSDPDVGLFSMAEPCRDCEGHGEDPRCAICGEAGDFSQRFYDGSVDDVRPCGCDVTLQMPPAVECACWLDEYGTMPLPETDPVEESGAVDEDDLEDLFAMSDREYDRIREQAATRQFRGRD